MRAQTKAIDAPRPKTILVAEDEECLRQMTAERLRRRGFEVGVVRSGSEAIAALEEREYDVVISDLLMPGVDGLAVLRHVRRVAPQTLVIVVSGHATTDSVIEALREGAADFIQKPVSFPDLEGKIEQLLERRDLFWERQAMRRQPSSPAEPTPFVIGESAAMRHVKTLIDQVAKTNSTVLITGESGAGKEVVARAIHQASHLKDQIFLPVNCAAIPDALLESELFGHSKGSFTGADSHREGLFRRARGGTLFLDEIGEMPLHLQAKLLRAIESKEILPLGSGAPVAVQVRIVASTNVDLRQAVEEKQFRQDLFYRLNVIRIGVPPLRERTDDIPALVEFLLNRLNRTLRRAYWGVDNATMACLLEHPWKGNVRELENVIEYAMTVGDGEWVRPHDLPPGMSATESASVDAGEGLGEAVRRFERLHIASVLQRCGNDRSRTARRLGIDRSTLFRKLKEHQIT